MKRDSLVIATASVMILAFTLSLLNIYVFPDIFFNTKIEYNTQSDTLLGLLHQAENIGVYSDLFENMNITYLLYDAPENAIVNISLIISSIEGRISAVYDFPELMPRRMTLNYNGTILSKDGHWLPNKYVTIAKKDNSTTEEFVEKNLKDSNNVGYNINLLYYVLLSIAIIEIIAFVVITMIGQK